MKHNIRSLVTTVIAASAIVVSCSLSNAQQPDQNSLDIFATPSEPSTLNPLSLREDAKMENDKDAVEQAGELSDAVTPSVATLPGRPRVNIEGEPQGVKQVAYATVLNSLYINQWVRTDSNGVLRGSVITFAGEDTVGVANILVTLAMQGRAYARVETNADGEFALSNVPSGTYTLVAEGENSFALFSVAVVSNANGPHLSNSIEIPIVRPRNEAFRELVGREMAPGGISDTHLDPSLKDPIGPPRMMSTSRLIVPGKDGSIPGKLSKASIIPGMNLDMSGMKAFLVRDGRAIQSVAVDRDGSFQFNRVAPGVYGLFASGRQGLVAFGFCVSRSSAIATKDADGNTFVAMQGSAGSLNAEVGDGADAVSSGSETIPPDGIIEEPLAVVPPVVPYPPGSGAIIGGGGGGPFGGGGGGGFGGGFGNIAGLLAAGGISLGLAQAIRDDNNNGFNNNQPGISNITNISQ